MITKEYDPTTIKKIEHVYCEPHEARDNPRHDLTLWFKNGEVLRVVCSALIIGEEYEDT